MEENVPKMDKIEVIDKDAILQIKFKGDFYERLMLVFKSTFDNRTPEEMQRALKQLESKKIEEEWVANYETMLYLIKGVEDYAKANNLIKMVDATEYFKEETPQ